MELEYLKDKFFMQNCVDFTKYLLECNLDINTTFQIIKSYQKKYIFTHCINPEVAKLFTWEKWWGAHLKKENIIEQLMKVKTRP